MTIKNKKYLSTILLAFAFILIAGVVYAAANGQLTFDGNVRLFPPTLDQDAKLIIIPAEDPKPTPNGSKGGMRVVSDDRAEIEVEIHAPDKSVAVSFQLKNDGKVPVVINAVRPINENPDIFAIGGDYDEFDGYRIEPGETEPLTSFAIEVISKQAYADDKYTFTIEMDYEAVQ